MTDPYGARADQLVEWLASIDLDHPSGHCMSWYNPDHPGYAYPEITGLLLSYLCTTDGWTTRRAGLARALLAEPWAGVGRAEVSWYAFDTAMALAGLVAVLERDDALASAVPDRAVIERRVDTWASALVLAVADARAREPQVALTDRTSWSDSFGAHQSKLAVALARYLRWTQSKDEHTARGDIDLRTPTAAVQWAADSLASATLALVDPGGRFRIHQLSTVTYLHAHCYALEGLVAQTTRSALDERLALPIRRAIDAGVAWLAAVQQPDGSLLAWHDGRRTGGSPRADATAQAVRLWLLVDPQGFASNVEAGLAFLGGMQADRPGVPYQPGSGDINAWASIFAAQALTWRSAGADATQIV